MQRTDSCEGRRYRCLGRSDDGRDVRGVLALRDLERHGARKSVHAEGDGGDRGEDAGETHYGRGRGGLEESW